MKFHYVKAKVGPETLYYCESQTQGRKMVPRALSICKHFATKKLARDTITKLQPHFPGLHFEVNHALTNWLK